VLLNPRVGAHRAVDLGLATAVLTADAFDAEVLAAARTVADGPTAAFATAKALINQAAGIDRLDHHLAVELQHLIRSADSDEFKEGLQAFFEKRTAVFPPTLAWEDGASSGETSPKPLRGGGGHA
jgi:enoyl-CoA hydratase/carnithine racemase